MFEAVSLILQQGYSEETFIDYLVLAEIFAGSGWRTELLTGAGKRTKLLAKELNWFTAASTGQCLYKSDQQFELNTALHKI